MSVVQLEAYSTSTHQLKPSRGSRGSGTIDCAMAAPRCVDAIVDHHHVAEKGRIIVRSEGRSAG
jgi:hypothetical protein